MLPEIPSSFDHAKSWLWKKPENTEEEWSSVEAGNLPLPDHLGRREVDGLQVAVPRLLPTHSLVCYRTKR